jgi:three-Cys-motif partner protein
LGINEVGYWTEIKIDIVRKYARAYSSIMSAQHAPRLTRLHLRSRFRRTPSKASGADILGSPTSVLLVDPPFFEYHLIDLDRRKMETLESMVDASTVDLERRKRVYLYSADCNDVLLTKVFPHVRYEVYRRGLCLLDPNGLHLDWQVIETAGHMRSLEVFLNFPIHDINRNVLRRDRSRVEPYQKDRLTRYWGDESWSAAAYRDEGDLFGFEEKVSNDAVVEAFRRRLREGAGFAHVSEALPMRNTKGATVYYLLFASQKPVAMEIVNEIFDEYRDRHE